MALTIKNLETISLARQLAGELEMTQTGAITYALQQTIGASGSRRKARAERVDELLCEIWDSAPPDEVQRIQANMDGLYDELGLIR